MSNCCIPYKKLNNINGSSLVTFNGKTSFDGVDNITVAEIDCASLQFSNALGGDLRAANISTQNITADKLVALEAKIASVNAERITATNINTTNIITANITANRTVASAISSDDRNFFVLPNNTAPTPISVSGVVNTPIYLGTFLSCDTNGLFSLVALTLTVVGT